MPEPTPYALRIENLNVWFELAQTPKGPIDIHVVRDVSIDLMAGERLGLVGESGSGKTTIALAAMGLLPSSARVSGRILLDGINILADGDRSVAPHRWTDIAMVFQGAMNAFNPVKSVGWQIAEAMEIHGVAKGRTGVQRVGELLDLVGIEPHLATRYPHEFSGGMRQRAIIAMALACDPKILLADEPTTALDVVVQDQVLQLLVDLSRRLDLGVILVTHDLGVVAETCARAAVMLKGELVEQGPVTDLYHQPQHAYTKRLFSSTPAITPSKASPSQSKRASEPLLEVKQLEVAYPARRTPRDFVLRRRPSPKIAVRGISLSVGKGELVALVGQSGCGKTSTLQAVLRMLPVNSGSLELAGRDITHLHGRELRRLRRHVQMIYQDPYESLDARFRVRDTVVEPLRIHGIGRNRAEREEMACTALERVGLTPASDYMARFPHELSGGQRQRVAIAASIILQPDLILADEPVSMLDVSVRTGILELLGKLSAESGVGILMITHDLSTAANYADRVAVMKDGLIVEQGPVASVIGTPRSDYTKTLLASIPHPDPEYRRPLRQSAEPAVNLVQSES